MNFTQEYEHGWSQEMSNSFTASLGIKIGAEGGSEALGFKVSTEISTELSWGWSTTTGVTSSRKESYSYTIDPHEVLHLWQVVEKFTLTRTQGTYVKDWTMGVEESEPTDSSCGAQ